jgi:hypothetical protein
MPNTLLELGARRPGLGASHLLELGATHLLELGESHYWMGDTPKAVPDAVQAIYNLVNVWDDPLAATGIHDDDLTPDALQLVNRIRNVNRRVTHSMGSSVQLGDIAGYDARLQLGYALHQHYLGKNFFKKIGKAIKKVHQTVAKKIINVVKSPAFLSVAALVVNIIPGVGQIASVGLAAAAAARKVYAQKVDTRKQVKAQRALTAAEAAAFLAEVKDYNKKTQEYYQGYNQPIPAGQLLNANGDPTSDPAQAPGIVYPINIGGTVYQNPNPPAAVVTPPAVVTQPPPITPPVVAPPQIVQPPPTQQQIVQAAAIPAAMALSNGQNAGAASNFLQTLPASMQQQAAQEVQEVQKFVQDPSFMPTSLKAIGQFVAMAEFDKGAGTGVMTPEQFALADAVKANASPEVWKAIAAGRAALITSAAIDGPDAVQAVQDAIAAGSGSQFPWKTVGLIAGGLAVVGGGVYALTRR